ncbi:MSMEG_1061 family FMN-dependent PPOX-type flavoprotein [Pseudalkalibacillus hwajinpoensis]|uniref:MSMEG_1061 family FMN-dependent PPOX-type flavoprotein n=1 Tax=Guptibacillus hwajinpoensis TaxID=208199 RepID=UPI00325BCA92
MNEVFGETVQSVQELEDIVGGPSKLAANKVIPFIDEHCEAFIAHAPFLSIASSSLQGSDVSPRGDSHGFVKVLDQKHLLIPERPGNKRVDSIRNILENPQVGLLFMIPGREETLRVNGKASIVKNKKLLEACTVNGKEPLLGIGVEVEECFIHCAKAFKRSHLWVQERWPVTQSLAPASRMLSDHAKIPNDRVVQSLKTSYTERLY